MYDPQLIPVLTEEQIQSRVAELARGLSESYRGQSLVLVGVLNGVFMFFADLAKRLTIPVEIDFVRVASYGSETCSSGRISMTKDVEADLAGKHVLIIEDIVDSGLTLEWLKKHLAQKGAASIKTCVLVNKHERRDVDVPIEFTGFDVPSGFLVGYGLDFNGRYRCLPAIYHLVTD
jgi:hypoxanthine phosphoribosyltransferase